MTAVEQRRLAVYRRWLAALVALSVYLMLTLLTQYAGQLHNPRFVLPHVGVLALWWVLCARMLMAWDRYRAGRAR